jgi:hypothetical protein
LALRDVDIGQVLAQDRSVGWSAPRFFHDGQAQPRDGFRRVQLVSHDKHCAQDQYSPQFGLSEPSATFAIEIASRKSSSPGRCSPTGTRSTQQPHGERHIAVFLAKAFLLGG